MIKINSGIYEAPTLLSLEDIKSLCIQYDKEEGSYPENEWEGKSVYNFIVNSFNDEYKHISNPAWEKEMKNVC